MEKEIKLIAAVEPEEADLPVKAKK